MRASGQMASTSRAPRRPHWARLRLLLEAPIPCYCLRCAAAEIGIGLCSKVWGTACPDDELVHIYLATKGRSVYMSWKSIIAAAVIVAALGFSTNTRAQTG